MSDGREVRKTTRSAESSFEGQRRVLVLAYYFPPMGMSGVQRTAKFVKYLPDYGWRVTVLTCEPRGYFAYDPTLLNEVEQSGAAIHRSASWDPTRFFGRRTVVDLPRERTRRAFSALSQMFFVPDNKVGWWLPARHAARKLLRQGDIDLIFSSAPPYTSHLIAAGLSRSTGLPLVLDFRDDWIGNPRHSYPTKLHLAASARLERRTLQAADRIVAINDVIRRNLMLRHPQMLSPADVAVIPQGFDPTDFDVNPVDLQTRRRPDAFTLVYSGVFYDAQTPEPFLRGLADVVRRRGDLKGRLRAVFVGLLPDHAKALIRELGITDLVHHTGYVPHPEAVAWLLAADVLWMTVGRTEGAESISTSKLFEYFGSRKPVLGLVPDGAAKNALEGYGAVEIVDPESVAEISAGIERLHGLWQNGRLPEPSDTFVAQCDRRLLTSRLARIFNRVLGKADSTRWSAGAEVA